MFQIKIVDKIKTHIVRIIISLSENRDVYEIMWTNTVQPDRQHITT
jgi:hypothetical protein